MIYISILIGWSSITIAGINQTDARARVKGQSGTIEKIRWVTKDVFVY